MGHFRACPDKVGFSHARGRAKVGRPPTSLLAPPSQSLLQSPLDVASANQAAPVMPVLAPPTPKPAPHACVAWLCLSRGSGQNTQSSWMFLLPTLNIQSVTFKICKIPALLPTPAAPSLARVHHQLQLQLLGLPCPPPRGPVGKVAGHQPCHSTEAHLSIMTQRVHAFWLQSHSASWPLRPPPPLCPGRTLACHREGSCPGPPGTLLGVLPWR